MNATVLDLEARSDVSRPAIDIAIAHAKRQDIGEATEATYAYLVDGTPASEDDADDAIRVTVAR